MAAAAVPQALRSHKAYLLNSVTQTYAYITQFLRAELRFDTRRLRNPITHRYANLRHAALRNSIRRHNSTRCKSQLKMLTILITKL